MALGEGAKNDENFELLPVVSVFVILEVLFVVELIELDLTDPSVDLGLANEKNESTSFPAFSAAKSSSNSSSRGSLFLRRSSIFMSDFHFSKSSTV